MTKTAIFNYIPHKRIKVNFQIWFNEYKVDLINLYSILIETLEERYDNIDINFNIFCNFIFNNSSGFILH